MLEVLKFFGTEWVLYLSGVSICLSFPKVSKAVLTDKSITWAGSWFYGNLIKLSGARGLANLLYRNNYLPLGRFFVIQPSLWRVLLVSIFTTILSISVFSQLTILRTDSAYWAVASNTVTPTDFSLYLLELILFWGFPLPFVLFNFFIDYLVILLAVNYFSVARTTVFRLFCFAGMYPIFFYGVTVLASVVFSQAFPQSALALGGERVVRGTLLSGLQGMFFDDLTRYCGLPPDCLRTDFLSVVIAPTAWSAVIFLSGLLSMAIGILSLRRSLIDRSVGSLVGFLVFVHWLLSSLDYTKNPRMYVALVALIVWSIIFAIYFCTLILIQAVT